jgi:hypothetical protein
VASVVAQFVLTEPELALLAEAGRIKDRLDRAYARLEAEGDYITTERGGYRAHPALVEARQQAMALGRILAALRAEEPDDGVYLPHGPVRQQRRGGFRQPYGVRSVSP